MNFMWLAKTNQRDDVYSFRPIEDMKCRCINSFTKYIRLESKRLSTLVYLMFLFFYRLYALEFLTYEG